MKYSSIATLSFGILMLNLGLLQAQENANTTTTEQKKMNDSVLLKPWTGPYGGVPPWDLVRSEEFIAAFETAIERAAAEIDQIATNPEPATFENTIVAMEQAGQALDRLDAIFGVHSSNLNLGPIPDIERVVAPKLAAHSDSIYQNSDLFERLETIYESDAKKSMTVAQVRLIDELYKTFVRRGAKLSSGDKARLTRINADLARLFTDFSQNVLEDEKRFVTWVEKESDLAGLPESVVASMKRAAEERGQPDQWAVTNTRSSMDPFLTYSQNRPLREQVWRTYYNRCDNGDEHDNNGIITEILALRRERAKLLGYPTHAHWRLEPTMAKTPEATFALMDQVWPKAVARVAEEVADMQKIADAEASDAADKITIQPWDYRFYAEKVRKAKYDLDLGEVKPYLQMERLREGMFWVAGELFGFSFTPAEDVPVFHPDVRVWEVTGRDGQHVGLWYFDPYARAGKRSGAWMTAYRVQQNMGEAKTPIVSNNSNFIPGGKGETVLISWDDAVTLFHEFGHALHGLSSQVNYPSQAGTSVARDYVEFPSQLLEHWLDTPEVLRKYCVHHETGQPLPQSLIDKIKKASTFNQGFATVEYLASAIVDMKLHTSDQDRIDPDAFERETLKAIGMPDELPMRHRTPHFAHIFSSDSYSAGYYSYLWADALTADAAEAFEDAGSFYDPELCKSLDENVFSVGDTIDPAEGFRRFRGRDVDTSALMRKRGF
ncbi:Peptidyl-dipeptidase dcp [Stieleria maiorica]|uniref:Peptidyl-dipeptidase dcp n=1 Tax=Stieleria maiorica TaxID=2795974 RepID=A0A5B9M5Y1_9BACT|nr:M3 family metallopeptidase [Stieleria maiorica]QEF96541.1 Peptidyl-dipeptidase dcp [Stieleria maiorica]